MTSISFPQPAVLRSAGSVTINRLFELDLGPVALALCGASAPDSQSRIDAIITEHGLDDFAGHFLRGCGLPAAADDLELFASSAALKFKEK